MTMANILITGANRGIGLEMTRHYAGDGDRVFACCRAPGKADALNELAKSSGGRITLHAMDVSDTNSIAAAAKDVGDTPIDILINNAGIIGGKNQSLENMDFQGWIDAFTVMTVGPFRVVQAFLENLLASKSPKIMTVTSQLGASTWPLGGSYAYGSAKAGVNRVMRSLAIDLEDKNVIVAMIHPGWVKTDMGGQNADITPVESASGIRKVIGSLTQAQSGSFFKWNGEIHPW